MAAWPKFLAQHHSLIQKSHHRLASATSANLINVGQTWLSVENHSPNFSLYEDGNHPSIHGSYLAALVIYANLTGGPIDRVTFVPSGISPDDAALIRSVASRRAS
jgi:hypothetical protein